MNESKGGHPTPRRRRLVAVIAVVASIGVSLGIPAAAAQSPTTAPAPSHSLQPMVIGGSDTLNDGFVAALLQTAIADPFQAQFCGGSLVSPNVVITAAHCVESFTAADFTVAVGQTTLSGITPADRIAVSDILIYPGWVPGTFDGVDIALVKLAADITTVAPVIIETDPVEPSLGRGMVVAGWGAVDPARNFFADFLQSAAVFAHSDVTTTPTTMFSLCGSTQPGDDVCFGDTTTAACNGDSGGPVLGLTDPVNGVLELEALVSFGPAAQCLSPVWWDAGQRLSPYKTWIDAGITAWAPPPPITVPSAPGTPTVIRGDASADISWTAPADNGGDPNLIYTVTGSPDGSCISNTTSCHMVALSNGVPHSFTVTATNSAGTGPASQPSTAVLAATLINCDVQTHTFLDVPADSFALADIGCILSLNVTHGTSATTYNPTGNVTREQMAAFLARLYRAITT